jgi:hypothetical protein
VMGVASESTLDRHFPHFSFWLRRYHTYSNPLFQLRPALGTRKVILTTRLVVMRGVGLERDDVHEQRVDYQCPVLITAS